MQVTLITIGTLKEKYLKEATAEYKKRISAYAKCDEIEIKEERISNEDDPSEISRALDSECDKVLASIPKGAFKVALCVEGVQYASEGLADIIRKAEDISGKICFIIGSSHGLSERVKSACDLRLSVSKLTFPHQLMRVLLLESIYRSFTIIAGKRYHK